MEGLEIFSVLYWCDLYVGGYLKLVWLLVGFVLFMEYVVEFLNYYF